MKSLRARYKLKIAASYLLIAAILSNPALADKLYPVDQGSTEPTFKAFREQLRLAVQKQDRKFIVNILDPNVLASFGGCEGIKCFQELWQLDKPNSKFWLTLSKILALGGSFDSHRQEYFCAPYVFSQFPSSVNGEQLIGVHEYAAMIGQNVNVRSRPSLNAPVTASLSYDIVKLDSNFNSSNANWLKIVTPVPGYVSSQFIRNPFDYRACFKKLPNKWVMTSLISGD